MIDLLLEKKYNIKYKYWYEEDDIICEVRAEYLGYQCGFRQAQSHYQLISANYDYNDIIEITMENLKNQVIKFIEKNLTTTL